MGTKRGLKEQDVRTIRDLAARGGANVLEMARIYGVGAETVRRVIRRETWNGLKESLPPAVIDEAAEASLQRFLAANPQYAPKPPEASPLERMHAGIAEMRERPKRVEEMLGELASPRESGL